MRRIVFALIMLLIPITLMGLLLPSVNAAKIAVPGGWEVDYTACTNGFSAVVNVPAGAVDALHEVVITGANPSAVGVPQTIYTQSGGSAVAFTTSPVYIFWDSPQAVGAPVEIFADRLEDGVSTLGGFPSSNVDTVQNCLIPEPATPTPTSPAPGSADSGPQFSDGRLDPHSHVIPYCGKPDGIEVWRWYPETLSSSKALDVSGEEVSAALLEAATDARNILIETNGSIDLWALSGGKGLQVQGRNFDGLGSIYNFAFPAALCDL